MLFSILRWLLTTDQQDLRCLNALFLDSIRRAFCPRVLLSVLAERCDDGNSKSKTVARFCRRNIAPF